MNSRSHISLQPGDLSEQEGDHRISRISSQPKWFGFNPSDQTRLANVMIPINSCKQKVGQL